ncbi:MAG: glycosyltransferase family 4 protein [Desulfobacteraceae bacterium]|nr:glycosyltransferase family 4 protein [Desulfobacteraceae bacterium]
MWDQEFVDDGCVLLVKDEGDVKKQAMAFADWCVESGVDIVMGINSLAILSALPHLSQKIRVLSRCANAFDHGYKITLSCHERLAQIIATTPRLKIDIINLYGGDEQKIQLIPNGISPETFDSAAMKLRGVEGPLRLGFVGRLEHKQKGVLFLPDIIRRLDHKGVDFTFRIAGKGVHKKVLERQLKQYVSDGRVRFEGALLPSAIADFLGEVDVFVFVSQFEGCPNALLEAMMAGCVPVTFKIKGITDFIVRDGITGFICPMAGCEAFADRIAELGVDRSRLQEMASVAAGEARQRFSNVRAAQRYAQVFNEVMQAPAPSWEPKLWSDFRPDPAFVNSRSWHSILPKPVKRAIKNYLFYVGLSDRYYD